MNKIIITEAQQKILENYQQLESNRNEVFNFYSSINYANIDFNGHDNIWEVNDDSDLNIDWSLQMITNENGFKLTAKVNYLSGKINILNYDTKEIKTFNIDKNWKINQGINFNNLDGELNTENISVFIDFNTKEIKI